MHYCIKQFSGEWLCALRYDYNFYLTVFSLLDCWAHVTATVQKHLYKRLVVCTAGSNSAIGLFVSTQATLKTVE